MQYWLMKSEPTSFSLEDLKNCPLQTECWDGVRNYQARNYMRDEMSIGDIAWFYHSCLRPSLVGLTKVVSSSYPDHTSWDTTSPYFDPKSTPENPRWFMVDVQFVAELARPILLSELRTIAGLEKMVLLQKGCRLSIQPVTPKEHQVLLEYTESLLS